MLKRMRGLEVMATVIVSAATIPFAAAWDAKNPGAQKYRETVKNIFYFTISVVQVMAGIGCAVAAHLMSIVYRKSETIPGRHPNAYLYRRGYRGRHYSGTPLLTLLTTKEPAIAVAA